jgi:hypothetical protein
MSNINLSKRITQEDDNTYRLQVWVSETSDNIPSEIFLHRVAPEIDEWDGSSIPYYGVCAYADLVNYAVDEPDGASNFYRKSGVDLTFKSLSILNQTWIQIDEDTQQLVDDIVKTNAEIGENVSYTGTNFNVVATLKHYDEDNYSYMLSMEATEDIFVVEKQSDGIQELVSVASLADMDQYSTEEIDTGYYRVKEATLFFVDGATYTEAKNALDEDFEELDAALSDPGLLYEDVDESEYENTETSGPYYFGE